MRASMRWIVAAALLPACGGGGGGGAVPAPPGAFLAQSPARGEGGVFVGSAFVWNASARATSYTFELASDSGFIDVLIVQAGLTTTSFTPAAYLNGFSVYFWRVSALNDAGTVLAGGMPWGFSTGGPLPGSFSLAWPVDGQTAVPVAPVYAWNPSKDATSYLFELSRFPDFSTLVLQQAGITQTSFVSSSELTGGTLYHWRVTAQNSVGAVVTTSSAWSFTTAPLSPPGGTGGLVAVTDTRPQYFGSVDVSTGGFTKISGAGLEGFAAIQGLAADPLSGDLYGSDVASGELLRIDGITGVPTPLGFTGFSSVYGLAFDPDSGTLYGTNDSTFQLLTFDTSTGQGSPVGTMGPFPLVHGLAYDPNADVLYGADVSLDKLIRVDPLTGAGTDIGPLGYPSVEGLGFNPKTNILYGIDSFHDVLLTVNRTSGAASAVGPAPNDGLALDFDSESNELYAWTPRALRTLNRSTGAGLRRGSTSFYGITGLAYDPNSKRVYGARMSPTAELFVVDSLTGVGRTIGPLGMNADNHKLDGLAFDPSTDTLYGVDSRNGSLMTVDTTTGLATVRGTPGIMGMSRITGLEFDPSTNTLYGADEYWGRLVRIDTATGALTGVGGFGGGSIEGLALNPVSGILYGTQTAGGEDLFRIDKASGSASRVGRIHLPITALAWDSDVGRLLGASTGSGWITDALLRIDPLTARATSVGALGFHPIHALAYDPGTGTVYGVWRRSNFVDHLLRIDPANGEATLIGPLNGLPGHADVEALAFDPVSRTLFGVDTQFDRLIAINTATGQSSVIGSMNYTTVHALATHPLTGTLYGVAQGVAPNQLVVVNPSTGAASPVGGSTGLAGAQGLAFQPGTNKLFAVNASRELVEVDPATGASVVVGNGPRVLLDLLFR